MKYTYFELKERKNGRITPKDLLDSKILTMEEIVNNWENYGFTKWTDVILYTLANKLFPDDDDVTLV